MADTVRPSQGAWGLSVTPESIPTHLIAIQRRWLGWRAQPKAGGKPGMDKVPVSPKGVVAHIDRALYNFGEVLEAYQSSGLIHGIGISLKDTTIEYKGETLYLVALDFDHCVTTDAIESGVFELLSQLDTYTELSPSGTGLRAFLFIRGGLPEAFRTDALQLFAGAGYVTVTGHRCEFAVDGVRAMALEKFEGLVADWRPAKRELSELGPVPTEGGQEDAPDWFEAAATEVLSEADRSSALAALTARALRQGPPEEVLWWLVESDAFQVALDHRRQSRERAIEYLWRHHCSQDVVRITEDDFEDLGAGRAGEEGSGEVSLLVPGSTLAADARPADWIVQGLLERGQVALLVAEESTGKTFVMLDICHRIGRGEMWGDFETTQCRVGYFSAEGVSGFKRRLAVLEAAHGPAEGLYVHAGVVSLTMSAERRLRLTDVFRAIVEEVEEKQIDLVVLDTLSANKGDAEENSNTEMAWLLAELRRWFADRGVTVVLVHHTRKDGDVFRGASALSNNSDVRFELMAHPDLPNRVLFTAPRLRDAAAVDAVVLRLERARAGEIESLVVEHVDVEEIEVEMAHVTELQRAAILTKMREYEHISAYQLSLDLRNAGQSWAFKPIVEARLKEMEEDHEVACIGAVRHNRAERWVVVDAGGLLD